MSDNDETPEDVGPGDSPPNNVLHADFVKRAIGKKKTEKAKPAPGAPDGKGGKQADVLIEIAEEFDLFHTEDDVAHADIRINGHRETWPVKSKNFRRFLSRRFHEMKGGAPGNEAIQAALQVIEGRAHFDGPKRKVHVRLGSLDGKLYLDLCCPEWKAVEISAEGWRLVDEPPVRFRRSRGMKPLPVPVFGGSVGLLRPFLNLHEETDFTLVVAWLLACLRDRGPYPVLLVYGEQGSAKSTFCMLLRSLVDPNAAPLRALPREDRDLFIQASNGHVIAFDNISAMPEWTSDALCRIATGGGFSVRQLYSDDDETLFDVCRPALLNGISDVVTRPDLADRALSLTLASIPENARRSEADLLKEFESVAPKILGALLTAVAAGLRDVDGIRLKALPRMADFAIWITACETELWEAGTFEEAYAGNRADIIGDILAADPVAPAVISYMQDRTEPVALSAAALLVVLSEAVTTQQRKSKTWPATPRGLSSRLRRAAPFLRKVGISIAFGDRQAHTGVRLIRLECDGGDDKSSDPSSSLTSKEKKEEQ